MHYVKPGYNKWDITNNTFWCTTSDFMKAFWVVFLRGEQIIFVDQQSEN